MYNVEIDGDHYYRVGEQGLLVHNASAFEPRPFWPGNGNTNYGLYDTATHEWVEVTGKSMGALVWAQQEAKKLCGDPSLIVNRKPTQVLPLVGSHIYMLDWSGTKLLGGHSRPLNDKTKFQIGAVTYDVAVIANAPSVTQGYSATIQLRTGGVLAYLGGKALEKDATMFPDSWDASAIEIAVNESFLDAYRRNMFVSTRGWSGFTFIGKGGGIDLFGAVYNTGLHIDTAYPRL